MNMSPVHPFVGKCELVRGAIDLPKKLELEPSHKLTADDHMRGRWEAIPPDSINLTYETFLWQGKVDVGQASLKLTDVNGKTNVYHKTSMCSSEMGTPCVYDK